MGSRIRSDDALKATRGVDAKVCIVVVITTAMFLDVARGAIWYDDSLLESN